MESTGERFIPGCGGAQIAYEHLLRRLFAGGSAACKRVLEIGSGDGHVAFLLAQLAQWVVGLDIAPGCIAHAAAKYAVANLRFVVGSALALPFTEMFDAVVCFEVIEQVDDPETLVREARRVMRPSGLFFVSTLNKESYSDDPSGADPFHVREFYFPEFRALLERHFRHVALYGQHPAAGACLWNLDRAGGAADGISEFGVEMTPQALVSVGDVEPAGREPLTFVAICSDVPISEALRMRAAYLDVRGQSLAPELVGVRAQATVLEGEWAQLQDLVRALETDLTRGQEQLTSAQRDLEATAGALIAANQELKTREQELAANHTRLARTEAELSDARRALADVQRTMDKFLVLQDGVGWKLLQRARELRLHMIPPGSRQERFWTLGVRFLRVWLEAGLRVALARAIAKVRMRATGTRMPVQAAVADKTSHVTGPPNSTRVVLETLREIRAIPTPPLRLHQANVEIVVCVHNALDAVKSCLDSIVRYTRPPFTLVIVDDGSEADTAMFVARFADAHASRLIRNEIARGYCRAANQALRSATAEYVILLNSDTIVTPDWLDRLVACAESDPRVGLVGPLSNTASWQSVPEVFNGQGDDWAENPLPPDLTPADMGALIAQTSARLYPRIPFLNGFCLLIRRQLIEGIGYFDEETFGVGYGEENDYCMRARRAGWELVVADDAYVFHAQSKSYSHEGRRALVRRTDQALVAKYGAANIAQGVDVCRHERVFAGARGRSRVAVARQRWLAAGREQFEGRRLLFLLFDTAPGGGGHVVLQEARAMREMGVDARLLNLAHNRKLFEGSYPECAVPVVYTNVEQEIPGLLDRFDAAVATLYASVDWIAPTMPSANTSVKGYYIQDFEPWFFPQGTREYHHAWASYTLHPDLVRFTKTAWNRDILRKHLNIDATVIGASVDLDTFRPRRRLGLDWPDRPLRIAAMIRPATPRRQAKMTMEVLRELASAHGDTIEIWLYGCAPDDPAFAVLPNDFRWRHVGVLTRDQLAMFLNEVDINADFSAWQAMGLSALQAMACGVAVIVPQEGGADSYAQHEETALFVDTGKSDACLAALRRLVLDESLRTHLQRQAVARACEYPPERVAFAILHTLFGGTVAHLW